MTDNVTFKFKGRSTPPDKTEVATDDVGGVHYQKIKVDIGTDGNSIPLEADGATRALPTIDYAHHEVHSGSHYYISGFTTLSDTGTLYVKLVTPNTTKWAHFKWDIESSGILETNLWEGSTGGMTGGTPVTPLNNNRNSTGTSGLTITSGVSVATSKGTKIDTHKVGGTGFKTVSGGSIGRDDEIILKQNETYFREFISGSTGNVISFKAYWYEHENL